MPFTKVKRKGRTMYRGPSGRVFNKKQVRRYYARGGTFDAICNCGTTHGSGLYCDASTITNSDPTGTLSLRRAFARELDRRWRMVKIAVNAAVRDQDTFALSPVSVMSAQVISTEGGRLKSFQSWFDAILGMYVYGHDRGAWTSQYITPAYKRGVDRALRLLSAPSQINQLQGRDQLLTSATVSEIQGVMEAVSQQGVRVVNSVLISSAPPRAAARAINQVIDEVGSFRGRAVASVTIVHAHATGTLDTFESLGVSRVGLEPESHRGQSHLHDWNPDQPRHPAGSEVGGEFAAIGGGSLNAASGPSSKFRSGADPKAHEVQLVNEKGVVQYRGEITEEKNNLWGVGYIENVTREHKGQAIKLYQEMARYAEEHGGRLVGGMNVNKLSKSVHEKLLAEGLAEKIKVGERELIEIHSKRIRDWLVEDARKKPTARQQRIFTRREQKLSRLGRVNVETAGDEKVCPVCEEIADEGPYTIDAARGLIPAHPSCRCAFVPADEGDAEDAAVSWFDFDPNQPRDPDGMWSETGAGISVYHGAPSSALKPILEKGFKLNNSDYRGHAVFVANSKKEALKHVEARIGLSDDNDEVPVIFKLQIPKKEWPTFKTDTEQKNAAYRNKAIPKEWIKDVTVNGKTFYPDVKNLEYMLRKDADEEFFETYFVLTLPVDKDAKDALVNWLEDYNKKHEPAGAPGGKGGQFAESTSSSATTSKEGDDDEEDDDEEDKPEVKKPEEKKAAEEKKPERKSPEQKKAKEDNPDAEDPSSEDDPEEEGKSKEPFVWRPQQAERAPAKKEKDDPEEEDKPEEKKKAKATKSKQKAASKASNNKKSGGKKKGASSGKGSEGKGKSSSGKRYTSSTGTSTANKSTKTSKASAARKASAVRKAKAKKARKPYRYSEQLESIAEFRKRLRRRRETD